MSELHSVRETTVSLFGVDVVVHHLSNGQRVIEEASMLALVDAMMDPANPATHADITDAVREILS